MSDEEQRGVDKGVTYACTNCGRDIFRGEDIIGTAHLWDLTEYQAEAYKIRRAIAIDSLRRYDTSLHEGWYCCRFIMMRMLEDKFGTGDALLVYKDSVVGYEEGQKPTPSAQHAGQVSLTAQDYDVITGDTSGDTLKVVKFGAIWCPPCRLVDSVITDIVRDAALPEVEFFEVNVDTERTLAKRFNNLSIPLTVFYYKGRHIQVISETHPVVDGGIIGGYLRHDIAGWSAAILSAAREGKDTSVF